MMKSAPIYLFPLWLLLLCISACQDKAGSVHELNRAEALMQEYPDSSLHVLKTLSLSDFRQESNQARFALLYSQALDKNYIDVADDSLISVAVSYYQDTDDARCKFLSYYYMGRVYANAADYLKAISCFTEAQQWKDGFEDNHSKGLLYSEMGRIYKIYYDYPKSLEAHQKAAEYYDRAGKIRHRNYMWLNQGNICRNINDYDESERLFQMILKSSEEEQDNVLKQIVIGDMIMQYVEQENMLKADSLYKELQCLVDKNYGSSSFVVRLAQMYLSFQDFVQAEQLIEEGWTRADCQSDTISLYMVTAELYDLQGKGKMAYQELQKGMIMQNKEAYQALQQPVLTAQRDYLSEKLEFEAYKQRMEKHLYILYILFCLLIMVVVAFFLIRKLRRVKEKARKTIDDLNHEMLQREKISRTKIDSLLQELENNDKKSSDSIHYLRSELRKQEENYRQYMQESECLQYDLQDNLQQKRLFTAELFKNWFEMMGTLVFFHEEKNVKESHKVKNIRKEIELMKEKYMMGNRAIRELERMVNVYHDNAMSHFRHEVSLADESDYRRVCYFFAGFPVQTIAWLMGEKADNVYQRRLRLRKYVASSTLPHKNLYLMLLCK